jgi:hypothetical protein
MQTTNPFPGMNPFLEGSWSDVHTTLIGLIREGMSDELPLDLSVRAEEKVIVGYESGEPLTHYRADVAISEVWPLELPGVWQPESSAAAIVVAEPEIIELNHPMHRWVEVRDIDGRLITVIEVLSPANKMGAGRDVYLQKQQDYLRSGVNLVEIDLLRIGRPAFLDGDLMMLRPEKGTRYLVTSTRARRPRHRELYYCPLRERLPAVRIPLRVTDLDVPLDLQPLIDRVYRTGRYWQISRREIPGPPLPADDASWAEDRLREVGLR